MTHRFIIIFSYLIGLSGGLMIVWLEMVRLQAGERHPGAARVDPMVALRPE